MSAIDSCDDSSREPWCFCRRSLLLAGASLVTMKTLGGLAAAFELKEYPRTRIASLGEIELDEPYVFQYPEDDAYATNVLVKLGEEAGGGVGPDRDIVAFNQLCTHMGGPLAGTYKKEHKVLGPCPLHLTTFDLTRHGMVISGHATDTLPQIVLEIEGTEIYATGIMGLLYGHTTAA